MTSCPFVLGKLHPGCAAGAGDTRKLKPCTGGGGKMIWPRGAVGEADVPGSGPCGGPRCPLTPLGATPRCQQGSSGH